MWQVFCVRRGQNVSYATTFSNALHIDIIFQDQCFWKNRLKRKIATDRRMTILDQPISGENGHDTIFPGWGPAFV